MKYSPNIQQEFLDRIQRGWHIVGPDHEYRPDGNIIVTVNHLSKFLHRHLYEVAIGPLARNQFLLPNCEQGKRCQNPYHRKVSRSTSGRTAQPRKRTPRPTTGGMSAPEINAAKTHCPQGHEYVETNLYLWTDGDGNTHRKCRKCTLTRTRARHENERKNK